MTLTLTPSIATYNTPIFGVFSSGMFVRSPLLDALPPCYPERTTSYLPIITTPTTQEDQAMSELLPLDRIATEGTQARVALSETIIHEYAEALKQGDEFPPIDVYYDDTTYWLGDGFHRVQAAKEAGLNALAATVHPGGQREA